MTFPAELADLGRDDSFAAAYRELIADTAAAGNTGPGRVTRVDRGACTVRTGDGEVRAEISAGVFHGDHRGALGQPGVGDWVVPDGDHQGVHGTAMIVAVLPRRTVYARQEPDGRTAEQVVAADIDTVFVVSPASGEQRLRRVERYLALAWQSGATPVVLATKADLSPGPAGVVAEVGSVAVGARALTKRPHR